MNKYQMVFVSPKGTERLTFEAETRAEGIAQQIEERPELFNESYAFLCQKIYQPKLEMNICLADVEDNDLGLEPGKKYSMD